MAARQDQADAFAALDELGEVPILEGISNGRTLRQLANDASGSRWLLIQWIRADEGRRERYQDALTASAGAMAEQGLEIVDSARETTAGVAKAKERAGYRKWLAGVRDPAGFGNRSKLEIEPSAELGAGLLAALLDYGHTDAPGMVRLRERGELPVLEGLEARPGQHDLTPRAQPPSRKGAARTRPHARRSGGTSRAREGRTTPLPTEGLGL